MVTYIIIKKKDAFLFVDLYIFAENLGFVNPVNQGNALAKRSYFNHFAFASMKFTLIKLELLIG